MSRHLGQPIDHVAARRLIDAYLVDELAEADAARLADHLRGCPACAAELGGSTRLIGLMAGLRAPAPTADLDERIILSAIADRRTRHERHSWIADLRVQILRGAMRTTGTLVATVVMVALLSVSFAFAAANIGPKIVSFAVQPFQPPATVTPTVTPTHVPTVTPTEPVATDTPGQPTPTARPATPKPTVATTPAPTPEPTPEATPTPSPTPEATPEPTPTSSVEPTASPTPTDTPTPSPTPTEKPKRTPTPAPTVPASDSLTPAGASTSLP